jgi:Domain of unknown function (DUF1741)
VIALTKRPGPEAVVLLSTYDFAHANKLFCFNLVTMSGDPTPFGSFLSLTSYLFQHAHRSSRSAQYTCLCLFVIQIIVEDQVLAKRICSEESKTTVRLCRQRQPYLPIVQGDRVLVTVLLDLMIDGINHNLRKKLDMEFYILCVSVLIRLVSFLSRSRTRVTYHWSELWRCLLSFIRFLTTYASDIKTLTRYSTLINLIVNLNALALSSGESFLPDASAYDDLFYKLVEAGDILTRFRDAYERDLVNIKSGAIDTLISVSRHYHNLIDEHGKSKPKTLTPAQVQKIIQQGYESLSIQAKEGLDQFDRFREANHKSTLKKASRVAIEDVKELIGAK